MMKRWRSRRANKLPRKPYMGERDLGYYKRPKGATGAGLVFRSGPYERRRFHTYETARAWAGEEPYGKVRRLRWETRS